MGVAADETVVRTRWRWIGRVLRRYDSDKRPRLTAWIIAAIIAIVALFGFLGYAIPALITRLF